MLRATGFGGFGATGFGGLGATGFGGFGATGFGVLGLAPRLKFDCSTLEGEGVSVMAMSKE